MTHRNRDYLHLASWIREAKVYRFDGGDNTIFVARYLNKTLFVWHERKPTSMYQAVWLDDGDAESVHQDVLLEDYRIHCNLSATRCDDIAEIWAALLTRYEVQHAACAALHTTGEKSMLPESTWGGRPVVVLRGELRSHGVVIGPEGMSVEEAVQRLDECFTKIRSRYDWSYDDFYHEIEKEGFSLIQACEWREEKD